VSVRHDRLRKDRSPDEVRADVAAACEAFYSQNHEEEVEAAATHRARPDAADAAHGAANNPASTNPGSASSERPWFEPEVHSLSCQWAKQQQHITKLEKRVAALESAIEKFLNVANESIGNVKFAVDLQASHTRILKRALLGPY
jgi:uncharacterized coiled-coil protein SlyX